MRLRPTTDRSVPRCALVVLLLLAACSLAAAGPRAVVEQTGVDLGEVVRGETVEAVFEISNAGDETLRILKVKPG